MDAMLEWADDLQIRGTPLYLDSRSPRCGLRRLPCP